MKSLAYIVAFIVTFSALAILAERAGVFRIHDVRIIVSMPEADFLLPKEKALQTHLDELKGTPIWKVHIADISRELLQNDWIQEVQITRRIPAQLEVRVKPQKISLIIMGKMGTIIPLGSEGRLMSSIKATEVPDVPILRGKIFLDSVEMRKRAIDLLTQLPVTGKLTANAISEISFDEREGFEILLRTSRARVQMGQEQFAQKAARISQVINYLDAHALEGRVIDASFSKKVLVRLRKGP